MSVRPKWNPRDLPGVTVWDAATYRERKPWNGKRSYSRPVRWLRRKFLAPRYLTREKQPK